MAENENFMKQFVKDNYDPHVEFNKNFIPRYHQILPKYCLATGLTNSLILHYSLGSGKTAAAVLSVLQHIKNNVNIDFLSQFLPEPNKYRKVCVVGSWQTQSQFEQELMRPEFQLVSESEMDEIMQLVNSPVKEQHDEGVKMYDMIKKNLNKHVSYIGYQSFFKLIFNFQNIKNIQNYKLLIEEFRHNRVSVNTDFIDSFSNSIIIIDEMQRLYSYDGLNTYGLAAAMLNSITKTYNIKVIYLTGTMFNTSETEIESISCFFTPEFKFLIDDSNFYSTELIPGVIGKRIKPEAEQYYIDLIKNNFAFYEQNDFSKSKFKTKILKIPANQPKYSYNLDAPINYDATELEDNVYVHAIFKKDKNLKCVAIPYTEKLPVVLYVGNCVIADETNIQQMITMTLDLEGTQNEMYTEMLDKVSVTNVDEVLQEVPEIEVESKDVDAELGDDDDAFRRFDMSRFENITADDKDRNSMLDIAQLAIPRGYTKLGIYKQSNGVYSSVMFGTDELKSYSKIAYTVIKAAFDLALHGEKTVIHTSRISKCGIEQYLYLFVLNGAVEYGRRPVGTSVCKVCGKLHKEHNAEEHEFRPIYIDKLTGFQSTKERSQIVNTEWNIAANLYGDIVSILLISDVAYTGVSLLNTQNIFLISPISNISKWRQIYSRIVRTNSHDGFPFEKKYAKVYTITVKGHNETNENCVTNKIYSVKSVLNEDIEKFIRKLSKVCINTLIETGEFTKNIKSDAYNSIQMMFTNDVQDELMLMFKRIFNNSNAIVWSKDALIQKIKDDNNHASFINFKYIDDNTIIDSLVINKVLMYDAFGNLELTDYYKSRNGISSTDLNAKRSDVSYVLKVPFSKFESLGDTDNERARILEDFIKITYFKMRLTMFNVMVMRTYVNRWRELFTVPAINDFLFEIYDEYYDDDHVNFIKNHSTNNRNATKASGCYFDNRVLLKSGEWLDIVPSFVSESKRPTGNYLFKITSASSSMGSRFYLHVIISDLKRAKKTEVNDARYVSVGVNCDSFNHTLLQPLLTNCDFSLSRIKFCRSLVPKICDFQLAHPETRYVITPFETF
jgi:hypothetical protein